MHLPSSKLSFWKPTLSPLQVVSALQPRPRAPEAPKALPKEHKVPKAKCEPKRKAKAKAAPKRQRTGENTGE